jgi:hypothetical protein
MARKIPREHLAAYTIQRNGITSVSRRNAVWNSVHPQWFKERLPRANHRIASECEIQYIAQAANIRRMFAQARGRTVDRHFLKLDHAYALSQARLMHQDRQRQLAKLRELR